MTKNKTAIIALTVFFVLALAIGAIFCFWQGINVPKDIQGKEQVFIIEKGQGFREIGLNLQKAGLIKSRLLFQIYAVSQGLHSRILAGKYSLSSAMTIPQILKKITKGQTLKEKITIIEGWNLKDIATYFQKNGIASKEEFFKLTGEPAKETDFPIGEIFIQDFPFLQEKPKGVSLEGYLFPDTYELAENDDLQSLLKRMLENFSQKISPELKDEIARQDKTLFDILIIASLLEKEVQTYEDKQLVAGILWKRLESGWPLQVDASLAYITGRGSQNLTQSDLTLVSPYNTYRFPGLPLGPICNPGLESIKAAVYYKESDNWFYLSKPDGTTVFSKTLMEHSINREEYLK